MRKTLFFILLFIISTSVLGAAGVINVTDYGAKPNSYEDASETVMHAIEACKKTSATKIIFPKGRYDFWPQKSVQRELYITNTSSEVECADKTKYIGLLLEQMHGVEIEGNGSLFVFHGKMLPWAFIECSGISFSNATIDFERPTMSEFKILEFTPQSVTVQVHPDSKFDIIDNKISWYGEGWGMGNNGHGILCDTLDGINGYYRYAPFASANVTKLEEYNKLRFDGDFVTNIKAGQILTVRNPIRDQVGAFVNLSKNIKLNNITMHYMHGLGITSQFSENLEYRNIKITPSRGRAIAAFADGMQFSGCKGYVKIDSCHFEGLHDDPINMHGTYLQIVEQLNESELVVEFKHHQTYGFNAFFAGDTVSFVSQAAIQSKGLSTIKSAELISERRMKIVLTKKLPKGVQMGDCVENMTWTPRLEVRNSRFERVHTRGLLVTTPKKVIVENNVFYRTGMYGIQIAADVNDWYESGAVTDVTINNNLFIDCAYNLTDNHYQIAIVPENKEIVANHWVHRNIKITNNRFETYSPQILRANSVSNLIFENNEITYSNPDLHLTDVLKISNKPAFALNNATKVRIMNNNIHFGEEKLSVEYINMKKSDLETDLSK